MKLVVASLHVWAMMLYIAQHYLIEYKYTVLLLWAAVVTGVLLHPEHPGGAVTPLQQAPFHTPPALFRDVGPSLDDWEKYLRNVADDLNGEQQTDGFTETSTTRRLEDDLFLQVNCRVKLSINAHKAGPREKFI